MTPRDVRAVENPISAIFDLAEDVNAQAPKIRKLMRYATVFVAIWLFINFLFLVVLAPPTFLFVIFLFVLVFSLRWVEDSRYRILFITLAVIDGIFTVLLTGQGLVLGTFLAALFVLGVLILNLIHELDGFFGYYVMRHGTIRGVREGDPVVYVPKGESAVDRLTSHLSAKVPRLRETGKRAPRAQRPAILKGMTGVLYSFDLHLNSPCSALWRWFGVGNSGYALFVKHFGSRPGAADIRALKAAVEDVSAETRIPPSRVIALWKAGKDETIEDDVYELLTGTVVEFRHFGGARGCTMELITEKPDGTYDFIPWVAE